jgi:predicted nucleic acid-binding protein
VDRDDAYHHACAELLSRHPGPLLVPMLVVTEVVHLLARRIGPRAEAAFLEDLELGNLIAEPVAPGDWSRIRELVTTYADLSLGTVDASVVALAERLDIEAVATLDRRHFAVVRPAHVPAFRLLP